MFARLPHLLKIPDKILLANAVENEAGKEEDVAIMKLWSVL